jgi:hypothetical protein
MPAAAVNARRLEIEDVAAFANSTISTLILAAESGQAVTIAGLMEFWISAQGDEAEASRRLASAKIAAAAHHPAVPDLIRDPRATGAWLSRRDLESADYEGRAFGQSRPSRRPRVEAYDRWIAQCEAVDGRFDVQRLEAALEQAAASSRAIGERIAALRPATSQEAAFKFRVLLALHRVGDGGLDDHVPIRAFLDDLEHVAGLESVRG